jgi:acyl carrier protein
VNRGEEKMAVTMDDTLSLVRLQLGKRRARPEDRFVEELGAESMDLVNIMAAAESRFNISLEDEDVSKILRVKDLYSLLRKRA